MTRRLHYSLSSLYLCFYCHLHFKFSCFSVNFNKFHFLFRNVDLLSKSIFCKKNSNGQIILTSVKTNACHQKMLTHALPFKYYILISPHIDTTQKTKAFILSNFPHLPQISVKTRCERFVVCHIYTYILREKKSYSSTF